MSQKSGIFGFGLASKRAVVENESPAPSKKQPTQQLPPYNVILLNDNDHTYDYVIQMLRTVFAYPAEKGFQLAKTVDQDNRAIVFTTHKELAELKREQIHAFGTDHQISNCKGSMSAIIEPAA